ncbi:PAS domain S-box protein [Halorubrum vacuolatum]|uniref:PAS domain S-box-containing protein n=1 Tax=Halorubrum vacuolatum TaxID=63740 RepID=A0A238WQT8_HALVU|nr:PAS domain S-box protein [Halorubrum vacuolatum]SNR48970.1 PAS domain S-box-containing protein [Halorubrum vacuolatum]
MSEEHTDDRSDEIEHADGTIAGPTDLPDDPPRVVRSFLEAVPCPTVVCDPQSLAIVAVNEPATELFGLDRGTLTLMGVIDLGQLDRTVDGTPVADRLTSTGVDGDRTRFEWVIAPTEQVRRHVEVSARVASIGGADRLVVCFRDATERRRAERDLRTQRRLVDAIAATIPAVLFQCGENGTLTRWNRRLETVSGYDAATLSDRSLHDLFIDGEDPVSDVLTNTYDAGDTVEREVLLITRSGERIPYRLTAGPIYTVDGDVIGAIGIGHDLTESSLREERLAVLTRVLRHNFRNELNVISGFTEQAIADIDDPTTVSRLERVAATAGRLLRVGETSRKVERLLDERPTPISISLSTAVADAIDSLPDTLVSRATIDVDVPESVTVEVIERFPEAIAELVDNAIRHNDSSEPCVTVRAAELPSESWVSLFITDNGPGIPAAERAVLTGEETQLEHASGLGLWYVNWIVAAGHGSLDISESKAGGSRVELTLRLADGRTTTDMSSATDDDR